MLHRALRRGRGVRRALPPRGVERRRAAAPARRRRLRPRRVGRHVLHRDGVRRGALAEAASSRTRAPLDPPRAIDLTIQILRAARFAHRRGIIHRDLKPHNVHRRRRRAAPRSPTSASPRAGASDMTQTGSIMGTAQYLSPEQAQGMNVSAASDLYSVGVILYELLAGRVPFDGESAVAIALKQVNERPVPPQRVQRRRRARARGGRAARAGEGPRAALPRRRRVHRRARGGASAGAMAHRGAGAAARPWLPPWRAAVEEASPSAAKCAGRGPWRWWPLVGRRSSRHCCCSQRRRPGRACPSVVGRRPGRRAAKLRQRGLPRPTSAPKTSDRPRARSSARTPGGDAGRQGLDGDARPSPTGLGRAACRRSMGCAAQTRAASGSRRRLQGPEQPAELRHASPKGHVIGDRPAEGSAVDVGSTVRSIVSSGPAAGRACPTSSGKTLDERAARARGRRLAGVAQRAGVQDQPAGTVLSQSPAAGTSVDKGATVTLTVAKAPAEVTVPDVTGEDEDDAIAEAVGRGLQGRASRPRTSTSPTSDGVVLRAGLRHGRRARRSPDAGTTRARSTGRARRRRRRPGRDPTDRHDGTAPDATATRPGPRHEGRGTGRRALLRARGVAGSAARRCARACAQAGHEVVDVLARPRRRLVARRRGGRAARRAAGCSAPTSSSRCCTGRSARTAPSRGCSSCSTCPTSASGVLRQRAVHGQGRFKELMARAGLPQVELRRWSSEERRGAGSRRGRARSACRAGSSRRGWARRSASREVDARGRARRGARRAPSRHDALVIVEADAQRHGGRVLGARANRRRARPPRRARSCCRRGRLVRLRGQVHAGRHGAGGAGADLRRRPRARARAGGRARSACAGCSGLARADFFVDGEATGAAQRAQHDARLHADERLRQALGGQRRWPIRSCCDRLVRDRASSAHRARARRTASERPAPTGTAGSRRSRPALTPGGSFVIQTR